MPDNQHHWRFIDTHCHFDFPPFCDDPALSWQQATAAGIQALLIPAVTADRFASICALTRDYSGIYGALGLHPSYIGQHGEAQLAQLETCLRQQPKKIVAIGEIGLDLYGVEAQRQQQQLWLLRQQLALAKRFDLPVILHCRRAQDLLLRELKRTALPRRGVIHAFTGSLVQAQAFIRLGYRLGVGGVITYSRANKTRQVIATVPLESLLLETDAPDMPLQGYQGQANRPERIVQVFTTLCSLRTNEEAEIIEETIYCNSLELFPLLR